MKYEREYEHDEICHFKKYVKQTLDLMVDSYKWKVMAKHCDDPNMKAKYHEISTMLYDMFMREHQAMGEMFKEA